MLVLCLIIPRTMATWGGSTQCALDDEGDEDGYLSEGIVRTDEEEEEQDASSNDNFPSYHPSMNQSSYNVKETKNRLVSVLKFYLNLSISGFYGTKNSVVHINLLIKYLEFWFSNGTNYSKVISPISAFFSV